jgi:hypothetical protein
VITTRRRSRSLLSLAIVLILISLVMNDIVVELVLLLLVVNYIVDLIMCVILVMCVIFVLYSLPILEAPRLGRQPKHAVVKKIKLLTNIWPTCQLRVASGVTYIRRLIYEYIGPPVKSAPLTPHPSMFIGDVSPMNVIGYIHWFHVIDEYTVIFVGTDE